MPKTSDKGKGRAPPDPDHVHRGSSDRKTHTHQIRRDGKGIDPTTPRRTTVEVTPEYNMITVVQHRDAIDARKRQALREAYSRVELQMRKPAAEREISRSDWRIYESLRAPHIDTVNRREREKLERRDAKVFNDQSKGGRKAVEKDGTIDRRDFAASYSSSGNDSDRSSHRGRRSRK